MEDVSVDRVEAAYRTVHGRLWRALFAYTGSCDLASDAESEAFAQALRRGDAVENVEAWVWRASFRVAGGLLAARRDRPSSLPMDVDGRSSPDSALEFVDLLGGLSDQQRACVVLRYMGGYPPREIADLLGTSSGTVRVQLHRAHQQLRTTIEVSE